MGEPEGEAHEEFDDEFDGNWRDTAAAPGLKWRVVLSIVAGGGWFVFILVWLLFLAGDIGGWEKNFAVFLLSLLVVAAVLGIPWTIFGLRQQMPRERTVWRTRGFRARVAASAVVSLGLFVGLIYWFWYEAEAYNAYQNIGIIVIFVVVLGIVNGALWTHWGMRHGDEFDRDEWK
jgi:heme/copper-type cytochrome/quinol oxidase subunit 4